MPKALKIPTGRLCPVGLTDYYTERGALMALPEKETLAPPRHIAIIMDGNGRWAKMRGMPRTAGHAAGAEAFRRIANYCRTLGVEYLTVYAFSTENWKRSADEVEGIMKLLRRYLEEALRDMEKNRVCFRFLGDLSRLSPQLQKLCRDAESRSESYDVQVNFCLNYGGRDEIVHLSVFQRHSGSGAYHSSLRGKTHQQFPAVAVCVF